MLLWMAWYLSCNEPFFVARRYRNQYSSDAMVSELEGSQNVFAPALLKTQMMLSAQVSTEGREGA